MWPLLYSLLLLPDCLASWAARAVLPALGAPSSRMLKNHCHSVSTGAHQWIHASSVRTKQWPISFKKRKILFVTFMLLQRVTYSQGVTKRCRLPWLTNSDLVCEPKWGGEGGLQGLSRWVQLCKWSSSEIWRSSSIFNLCLQPKGTYKWPLVSVEHWPQKIIKRTNGEPR